MTEPVVPTREVAGLSIPLVMIPRIITALRATYPGLTDGIADDEAAVRAVLKEVISSALSVYESRTAANEIQKDIEDKRATLEKASADAYLKARSEVAAHVQDSVKIEPPTPPVEPEPSAPPAEPVA